MDDQSPSASTTVHRHRRSAEPLSRRVHKRSVGKPVVVAILGLSAIGVGTGQLPGQSGPDAGRRRTAPASPFEPASSWDGPHAGTQQSHTLPAASVWRGVLARLDADRTKAWRLGRPRQLRAVYAPRSPTLEVDRNLMRAYLERGLRVRGVSLRFARIRVLAHRAGNVEFRVVDRLGAMTALAGDGQPRPLPRDRATRHEITLVRVDGDWRVATVETL